MKERPILFSAPMVRAILDGRKTQTRRMVNPQPEMDSFKGFMKRTFDHGFYDTKDNYIKNPYGQPGDRLWVRETCRAFERPEDMIDGVKYLADDAFIQIEDSEAAANRWIDLNYYRFHAKGNPQKKRGQTVPPIHMPRWASRILLEITDVRVERLQEISTADIAAEGFDNGKSNPANGKRHENMQRIGFMELWDKLNAKRGFGWDANPWVWVVSFKRIAS